MLSGIYSPFDITHLDEMLLICFFSNMFIVLAESEVNRLTKAIYHRNFRRLVV
jgi:hypothetical protein